MRGPAGGDEWADADADAGATGAMPRPGTRSSVSSLSASLRSAGAPPRRSSACRRAPPRRAPGRRPGAAGRGGRTGCRRRSLLRRRPGPAEHRRQRWSRDHGQRPNSGDRSASALAVRRCRSTGSEGGRMQCLASTPGRSAGTRASSQAAAPAPEEYGPGVAVQGWNLAARKLPLPPVGNCSEIVKLFAPVPKQNLALARPVELLAVQKLFRLQC